MTIQHSHNIQLIYAGGTFGCYGTPLAPLPSTTFLPELMLQLNSNGLDNIDILGNHLIKDSSQLSPVDFFWFFELILSSYAQGHNGFVLITGTDTLSYLGAFLAEAFAGTDICIALTASMRPFFDSSIEQRLVIDKNSDAVANLQLALKTAQQRISGVYTCVLGQAWHAHSVQKIHSQDVQAFIGNNDDSYPANSYQQFTTQPINQTNKQAWIDNKRKQLEHMKITVNNYALIPVFVIPNHVDTLMYQLESAIKLAHKNKQAVSQEFSSAKDVITDIVLMGFGAGNVPYDKRLTDLLDHAHQSDILVICTTQCPFGGVSADYAAGSWQYQHHVLSAGKLSTDSIFARLLWLAISEDSANARSEKWQSLIMIDMTDLEKDAR